MAMKQITDKILNVGTLISVAGFVGATLVQIFARSFLESAPSWTEEASRFFFIYAMSFAAALAMKGNYYVYLDILYAKVNKRNQKRIDFIVLVAVLILFIVVGICAIQYMILGIAEHSPSMGIPMVVPFTSIFIMAFSICLYAIYELTSKNKSS